MPVKGLLERLKDGEDVVVAEGYLFNFESRGYLKAGAFVPEVVIEHPDLVRALHQEFVHAGSDVVQAFTYYGHRDKLRVIGREDELEKLNREALRIARKVADETGTLMAGNICNTTIWSKDNPEKQAQVKAIFKEQIEWAVEEGADFIIGETFHDAGEAVMATQCIKEFGKGLPSVVTILPLKKLFDGYTPVEGCKMVQDAGADVVGLNCYAGPDSTLPVIKEVRKAIKGPLACLPVAYRTDEKYHCMQDLPDVRTGKNAFPDELNAWLCSRSHFADFGKEMKALGVQYMGVCCGNQAQYIRAMAEALGRRPPASKYSPDMSQHLSVLPDEPHAYGKQGFANTFIKHTPKVQ